jgi:hypothetical protein
MPNEEQLPDPEELQVEAPSDTTPPVEVFADPVADPEPLQPEPPADTISDPVEPPAALDPLKPVRWLEVEGEPRQIKLPPKGSVRILWRVFAANSAGVIYEHEMSRDVARIDGDAQLVSLERSLKGIFQNELIEPLNAEIEQFALQRLAAQAPKITPQAKSPALLIQQNTEPQSFSGLPPAPNPGAKI